MALKTPYFFGNSSIRNHLKQRILARLWRFGSTHRRFTRRWRADKNREAPITPKKGGRPEDFIETASSNMQRKA